MNKVKQISNNYIVYFFLILITLMVVAYIFNVITAPDVIPLKPVQE
ncbi:MAG: hypothetical protein ACOX6E_08510 [Syntrophomonadaceae bacterium]|jgi:hypothetical protein